MFGKYQAVIARSGGVLPVSLGTYFRYKKSPLDGASGIIDPAFIALLTVQCNTYFIGSANIWISDFALAKW